MQVAYVLFSSWQKIYFLKDLARFLQETVLYDKENLARFSQETVLYHKENLARFLQEFVLYRKNFARSCKK